MGFDPLLLSRNSRLESRMDSGGLDPELAEQIIRDYLGENDITQGDPGVGITNITIEEVTNNG